MEFLRNRWTLAAALVAATALAGAATRGPGAKDDLADGSRRYTARTAGPVSLTGTLDRTAVMVGGDSHVRMELAIAAGDRGGRRAVEVPTDLVVVLDRSGSMGGEKIEHARAAIAELVSQLRPDDRFALVSYSDGAWMEIPPAAASADARASWRRTIAAIGPLGGTNLSAGLDLGLDTIAELRSAGRVPRAILISDGLANQGDASLEGLVRRAARAAKGEYMLTTVGVGADFNEYLMTALADAGTGNYYYLESARNLAGVFAKEFAAARTTVASGLEVRIEPGDGVTVLEAAGYPLEHTNGAVVFRPGSLFAGQERRVWVTLSVPNGSAGEHGLGRFSVAWTADGKRSVVALDESPRVASVAREDEFYAAVDVPAWTRAVVIEGYNQMQEEVARKVKEGKRDAALEAISKFRDEADAMNAQIGSAPVARRLDSLEKLEAEVAAAFEGDDQAGRQNELSKARSADALDQRRRGAK